MVLIPAERCPLSLDLAGRLLQLSWPELTDLLQQCPSIDAIDSRRELRWLARVAGVVYWLRHWRRDDQSVAKALAEQRSAMRDLTDPRTPGMLAYIGSVLRTAINEQLGIEFEDALVIELAQPVSYCRSCPPLRLSEPAVAGCAKP